MGSRERNAMRSGLVGAALLMGCGDTPSTKVYLDIVAPGVSGPVDHLTTVVLDEHAMSKQATMAGPVDLPEHLILRLADKAQVLKVRVTADDSTSAPLVAQVTVSIVPYEALHVPLELGPANSD